MYVLTVIYCSYVMNKFHVVANHHSKIIGTYVLSN